jgi:hypothetical protein
MGLGMVALGGREFAKGPSATKRAKLQKTRRSNRRQWREEGGVTRIHAYRQAGFVARIAP